MSEFSRASRLKGFSLEGGAHTEGRLRHEIGSKGLHIIPPYLSIRLSSSSSFTFPISFCSFTTICNWLHAKCRRYYEPSGIFGE